MNFVIKIAAALALLALVACGGGSGSDSAPPAGGNSLPPPAAIAPIITTQPVAQSVTTPDAATFSVVASGTAPLTYQWRSSVNGTDWSVVAGAVGPSYGTGATDVGMNGRYYSVVVSNSVGSVTSTSALLTALAATSPPAGGGGSGGGSGGGGGTGGGNGPIGPSGEFPHAAAPSAVAVTLANAAVAGFSVSSSSSGAVQIPGGASDIDVGGGVSVSFGFPGDTFLEDQSLVVTTVTLAGVDSGHPLPLQSVMGAFVLDPSDTSLSELRTNNLVRVTFTLTQQALDALGGTPVIFSARSDGTDLHLVPAYANADSTWSTLSLTTGVDHLGIFGIATVDGAQAAALAAAWPSYDDLQLEAALAPASYEWRKVQLAKQETASSILRVLRFAAVVKAAASSGEDDWFAQMQARLDAYYNDEVVPALNAANAASADLAQFRDASEKLATWERQRQLLGLQDDRDAVVSQQMIDLMQRGLEEALQDCSANRDAAAAAEVLGLARQLALLGVETVTSDSALDTCGRSTYDVSVDWKQVHTADYALGFDGDPANAFTGSQLEHSELSGHLHLSGSTPGLNSVSFDYSLVYEKDCADGAFRCTFEKTSTVTHDPSPSVTQCGAGFFGSYAIESWNLDARGHNAKPHLSVRFVNSTGCTGASFIAASSLGTETRYDISGNVTSTRSVGTGESVDTVPWSGGVNVGSTSRIVRRSAAVTGQNIEPGAMERWTTSLAFTITEVVPTN